MSKEIERAKEDKLRMIVSITMRKSFYNTLKPKLKESKLTMSSFIDYLLEDYIKTHKITVSKDFTHKEKNNAN